MAVDLEVEDRLAFPRLLSVTAVEELAGEPLPSAPATLPGDAARRVLLAIRAALPAGGPGIGDEREGDEPRVRMPPLRSGSGVALMSAAAAARLGRRPPGDP